MGATSKCSPTSKARVPSDAVLSQHSIARDVCQVMQSSLQHSFARHVLQVMQTSLNTAVRGTCANRCSPFSTQSCNSRAPND